MSTLSSFMYVSVSTSTKIMRLSCCGHLSAAELLCVILHQQDFEDRGSQGQTSCCIAERHASELPASQPTVHWLQDVAGAPFGDKHVLSAISKGSGSDVSFVTVSLPLRPTLNCSSCCIVQTPAKVQQVKRSPRPLVEPIDIDCMTFDDDASAFVQGNIMC